ncbi:MAG: RNA polymerase sigma factor [Egibacteraceae bacterium]
MTELVRFAALGDEGAWEVIVTRYRGLLWHIARAYRLTDSEAADVVQTTWLRLVQHLECIRNPEAVGAWLVTTARRESLRALRLSSRERPTADANEPEAADWYERDPEAQALTAEVNSVLWRCVDEMPARDRTLLRVLMADPPASYQEISAALNMPIGSIGPTRARCLQRLRHSVERAGVVA